MNRMGESIYDCLRYMLESVPNRVEPSLREGSFYSECVRQSRHPSDRLRLRSKYMQRFLPFRCSPVKATSHFVCCLCLLCGKVLRKATDLEIGVAISKLIPLIDIRGCHGEEGRDRKRARDLGMSVAISELIPGSDSGLQSRSQRFWRQP